MLDLSEMMWIEAGYSNDNISLLFFYLFFVYSKQTNPQHYVTRGHKSMKDSDGDKRSKMR